MSKCILYMEIIQQQSPTFQKWLSSMDKQKDAFCGGHKNSSTCYIRAFQLTYYQVNFLHCANHSLLECSIWASKVNDNDKEDGTPVPNDKWQATINSWISKVVMATSSRQMETQRELLSAANCVSSTAPWRMGNFATAISGGEVPSSPTCQKWQFLLAKKWVSFIVSLHTGCIAAAVSGEAPGGPFMLVTQTLLVVKLSLLTA